MRLALDRQPTPATASRYLTAIPNADRQGPSNARVDTYRRRVDPLHGESADATFERVRRQLFQYDIFSPKLVGHLILPEDVIADGCTVVQRIGVGPVFVESATRVVDVWNMSGSDGSRRSGFAYVTLGGHPERGVATFEVSEEREGVFVVLTARSVPGTIVTTLARPFVRLVQRAITRHAVRRLTSTN